MQHCFKLENLNQRSRPCSGRENWALGPVKVSDKLRNNTGFLQKLSPLQRGQGTERLPRFHSRPQSRGRRDPGLGKDPTALHGDQVSQHSLEHQRAMCCSTGSFPASRSGELLPNHTTLELKQVSITEGTSLPITRRGNLNPQRIQKRWFYQQLLPICHGQRKKANWVHKGKMGREASGG